jgi:osmotically-inducible protein OsmY
MLRLTGAALAAGFLFTGSSVSWAETTKAGDTVVREEKTKTTKSTKSTVGDKHGDKTSPSDPSVAADNTGTNKRDRNDAEKTADQAKNKKSDVELTAEIRRAIIDDKTLSTNAHNVKIIVENGNGTLKGPVGSAAEKATVAKKATAIIGRGKVVDEMAIAP